MGGWPFSYPIVSSVPVPGDDLTEVKDLSSPVQLTAFHSIYKEGDEAQPPLQLAIDGPKPYNFLYCVNQQFYLRPDNHEASRITDITYRYSIRYQTNFERPSGLVGDQVKHSTTASLSVVEMSAQYGQAMTAAIDGIEEADFYPGPRGNFLWTVTLQHAFQLGNASGQAPNPVKLAFGVTIISWILCEIS